MQRPSRCGPCSRDLDRYDEWNPGFAEIHGRVEVGTKLDVTFARKGAAG